MAEVMKRAAASCPDLETIAAYLDGRLSDRDRTRITEHLADCEDCYAVFSESAQTHVAQTARTRSAGAWREWFTGPRLVWSSAGAALAVAASALLLVIPDRMMSSRQANRELRALAEAMVTERATEGRLAGGFAYARLRGPIRSGASSAPTLPPDIRIAAAHSEKVLAGIGTAQALHTLGIAILITGDLDRAVPTLERAVDQPAPDARFLSDLSAAYLARAMRDGRHQDLVKALAAADRAVKADPALVEALFNRALALERLSRGDEARTAWQDYLRVDATSGWADEARSHASILR